MADLTWFNPAEVPEDSFAPLPACEYKVIITESTDTTTKKGDGKYFNLKLEIIDGPQKGRVLFDKLNYHNPDETARKMAQQSLKAICEATGVLKPRDTMQLHGIPIIATVVIKEGKNGYGPQNVVKRYKKVGSVSPPARGTAAYNALPMAQQADADQAATSEQAPWG